MGKLIVLPALEKREAVEADLPEKPASITRIHPEIPDDLVIMNVRVDLRRNEGR